MNRALSETETSRLMQNGIEVTEHLGSGTSSEVFAIAPYKGVDCHCQRHRLIKWLGQPPRQPFRVF